MTEWYIICKWKDDAIFMIPQLQKITSACAGVAIFVTFHVLYVLISRFLLINDTQVTHFLKFCGILQFRVNIRNYIAITRSVSLPYPHHLSVNEVAQAIPWKPVRESNPGLLPGTCYNLKLPLLVIIGIGPLVWVRVCTRPLVPAMGRPDPWCKWDPNRGLYSLTIQNFMTLGQKIWNDLINRKTEETKWFQFSIDCPYKWFKIHTAYLLSLHILQPRIGMLLAWST